jgi:N-formylglutamate amidohydrolase
MRVPGLRFLAAALLATTVACGGAAATESTPPPPTQTPTPTPPLDVAAWISVSGGDMPLVIIAPHGGDITPGELPDRSCTGCVTVNDANTQALALAIADAFEARIALRPFVVANRLNRRKFDANRDLAEATGNYSPLAPMWTRFHQEIDSAKARAVRTHPRALLIDLHGHAHSVARLELGYLLTGAELRLTDEAVDPLLASTSIARLESAATGDRGAALLRGPRALGTRLAVAGYPSVPSASDPAPLTGQAYFNGGFNTARHGSRTSGPVDAVQIECNYAGVRDTAESRAAFAEALVTALLAFLNDQYGWTPA